MGLFQKSVLKKYKSLQDKKAIEKAFKKYVKYFHNPEIQQNIRESKEEQYQEGFLRELFVNILNYTINPNPNFNLTTELKNEKGAKKADGAILQNGKAIAVIELKGTKTKDLESIRKQAFDYKSNQSNCVYVITSNFEKLRFYIENSIDFEEFNLFTLNEKQFELLYLCLHKENVLQNIPLKIKSDSVVKEEEITKEFYKDYSVFKRELFRDLVKQNMKNEVFRAELQTEDQTRAVKNIKLSLFKKSQKLIDRFLFVFFAEDKSLLPPNSTIKILDQWKSLKDMDAYVPLYDRYKLYFKYLDTGRKGTDKTAEIFAYNGGLFKPDPILDSLLIDDNLLYKHTETLSTYNFESQVSVNILGHIFENSLNEIESVNAEIEGAIFDKQKTKRKKDGVFYTPKYITKYIVDNTIGKLCEEKKQELSIAEEDYKKNRKGRKTETIKRLKDQLEQYRNWLLELTILDPACGSGAFLNQALDFLITEHKYIDELETSLLGGGIVFQNIENTILEKNIFGVDLNEESVEIAKLSLWLRTAQPRRKLNSLNNNIKCGNSLIDDPKIAGDKAFNWQEEFSEIFKKGGFDCVIGNPPYGIFLDSNEEKFYKSNFPLTNYKLNLYILFIERMFQIFDSGLIHFIIPKSLLFNTYFENIRKQLLEKSKIHEIFLLSEKVFSDAEVGGSLLLKFELSKKTDNKNELIHLISSDTFTKFERNDCIINNIEQDFFLNTPHCEISPIIKGGKNILSKLHKFQSIKEYYKLKNGLNPGNIKHILISDTKETDYHKPIIWGKEFTNYLINWGGQFVNYNSSLADNLTLDDIKSKEGMKKQSRIDFALRKPDLFETTKLLVRKTGDKFIVAKDIDNLYFDTLVHGIYQLNEKYDLDFLLAVLNSKTATKFYRLLHDIKGKVFAKISLDKLGSFPLPLGNKQLRSNLAKCAVSNIKVVSEVHKKSTKFLNRTKEHFEIEKVSKKLSAFYNYDFKTYVAELKKQKVTLSLIQQDEWQDYFNTYKTEINQLQTEIQQTDNEIDQMVYKLYELTPKEIEIIENATT